MKKRLVAILTVICLAVSLSGCNFNINTNNPNPNDYEGPPDEFPSQQTSEADPFGGLVRTADLLNLILRRTIRPIGSSLIRIFLIKLHSRMPMMR